MSGVVDDAVFELPAGTVSDPIATPSGIVIARMVERQEVVPTAMEAARTSLREELVSAQRGRFFAAYMQKAKERIKPAVDQEMLRRATTVAS